MRTAPKAVIASVESDSPAALVGLEAGDVICTVDGYTLRDIIDWRWYASEEHIAIDYLDVQGNTCSCELSREYGQDWGIDFTDVIFDEPMVCRNRCTFCFMQQLPEEARVSLKLRDDDYRLSFLQGNFVTFTNVSPPDIDRIIAQHLSPLRFSLHTVDPALRERIIGPYAQQGIDAADQLLEAGIELHAQIVLMPHVNDGAVLEETLAWAWMRPRITKVAIVPVGFTSHQSDFTESYQQPRAAQAVLDIVRPFQERALEQRRSGWVYPSDEFYRNAFPDNLLSMLPPSEFYGEFEMFEDGIGIVRSAIDDWLSCVDEQESLARLLQETRMQVVMVCGCAQREFLDPLVKDSPLNNVFVPLYVENDYFGGNVDVTGLLCGCDIARAVSGLSSASGTLLVCIPSVVLNADGVTLDDMTPEQISAQSGRKVHVVSCEASKYLPQIRALVEAGGEPCQDIS